jgi:hypothetical protein
MVPALFCALWHISGNLGINQFLSAHLLGVIIFFNKVMVLLGFYCLLYDLEQIICLNLNFPFCKWEFPMPP